MGKIDEALRKAETEVTTGSSPGVEPISIRDEAKPRETTSQTPSERESVSQTKAKGERDSRPSPEGKTDSKPVSRQTSTGVVDYRIVVYHKPESLAAEHFKVLRSNIMHPASGGRIKSVLITSALEQEGKTLVACNLAMSIAQSLDPYVMLIDADVRRPNVHNMLGLTRTKGLTDYLETQTSLANYLVKGPLDKMTILQAGSTVRNPAELITSDKMRSLVEEARQRYEDRFIVIDSPPVNLAAETLVLAQQVDAIIMVVRYGSSDRNAIEEALTKLNKDKVMGVVFNGFEIPPRKFTYYKKKYYYSSYGY